MGSLTNKNPYSWASSMGRDAGAWVSNRYLQSQEAKNLFNTTVEQQLKNNATQADAEKAGNEAVKNIASAIESKWSSAITGIGVGLQGIGEAYKGWNTDYMGTDISNADNVVDTIYNSNFDPNAKAWSNLRDIFGNDGGLRSDLKKLYGNETFNSNAESSTSLATDWRNQYNPVDYTGKDRKFFGFDNLKQYTTDTAKGAMAGFTAGGPWGALAGAIVGSGLSIYNFAKGKDDMKLVKQLEDEKNQRMFQQAQTAELNRQKKDLMRQRVNNIFAQGGNMNNIFGDFDNGMNYFAQGGSHEANPNGGILQGIAPDGQPNLVEEGEVKFNDYIYSKRLNANADMLERYNIPVKYAGKSYADIAEKLGSESKERPNDPYSEATQKEMLGRLADAQEAQRIQKQMEEFKQAMANLPIDQQQAVLQNMMQQSMETQQMQYPQQEISQGQMPMEQPIDSIAMMGAYGGNLFVDGGTLKQKIFNELGVQTNEDFERWLKSNNLTAEGWKDWNNYNDWKEFLQSEDTLKAIGKTNDRLPYMIANGYDFTEDFTSNPNEINIGKDNEKSNWKKSTTDAFLQSGDAAAKGLDFSATATEQDKINAIKNSQAYIKTTEWLEQSPENRLKFLAHIAETSVNDDAKKYATNVIEKDANGNWVWKNEPVTIEYKNGEKRTYTPEEYRDKYDYIKAVRDDKRPGTYWRSYDEAIADNKAVNLVKGPDGNWEVLEVDPDKSMTNTGTYTHVTNDGTPTKTVYNFYTRPEDITATKEQTEVTPDNVQLLPTWMRQAGAVLPLFGALNAKSDYSNDRYKPQPIAFEPVSPYLPYRPLDREFYINSLSARQRNQENNLMNLAGANRGAAANLMLAANAQNTAQLGDLYRMAEEYNAKQRADVASHNLNVNRINSEGFFNADAKNQADYQQALDNSIRLRHNIDAATAAAKSAGYTQFAQNLMNIGTENFNQNMIATNPAYASMVGRDGRIIFKAMQEYAKNHPEETGQVSACGGKLNTKRRK